MNSWEYAEKLKNPKWQKKRLKILERAGWKCESCGSEDQTLHVHHLIYSNGQPWEAPDDTLESLCEGCHQMREDWNTLFERSKIPTVVVFRWYSLLRPVFMGLIPWKPEFQFYDRLRTASREYYDQFRKEISESKPDQATGQGAERPRDVHANSGNGQCAPPDGDQPRSTSNPGERKQNTAGLSDLNQSGETMARSHTPSIFAAPTAAPDTAAQGSVCQSPNIRPI